MAAEELVNLITKIAVEFYRQPELASYLLLHGATLARDSFISFAALYFMGFGSTHTLRLASMRCLALCC